MHWIVDDAEQKIYRINHQIMKPSTTLLET